MIPTTCKELYLFCKKAQLVTRQETAAKLHLQTTQSLKQCNAFAISAIHTVANVLENNRTIQTWQVSRNFRESPEISPDLQVSRKCAKNSRNSGNLREILISAKKSSFPVGSCEMWVSEGTLAAFCGRGNELRVSVREKLCHYPPPPTDLRWDWRPRKISATTPPPLICDGF